jgi:hypothetical protein
MKWHEEQIHISQYHNMCKKERTITLAATSGDDHWQSFGMYLSKSFSVIFMLFYIYIYIYIYTHFITLNFYCGKMYVPYN